MKTDLFPLCLAAVATVASVAIPHAALAAAASETRPAPDASAGAFTMEPSAVLIQRPVPEAVMAGGLSAGRVFAGQPGTAVELTLRPPKNRKLISLDVPASKIAAFSDDRGTDLLVPPAAPTPRPASVHVSLGLGRKPGINTFASRVIGDGRAALVAVESPGLPGKGATVLRVKGALAVRLGGKTEDVTLTNLELKKGKLDVKGLDVSINAVDEQADASHAPGGSPKCTVVTLKLNEESADTFIAANFSGANGRPVEQVQTGTSILGHAGVKTVTYRLKAEGLQRVSITFSYWTELHTVVIPLDVVASLGG